MGPHTADKLANSAKRTEYPASFLDCTNDLIRRVTAGNVCAVIPDILVWGGWRAGQNKTANTYVIEIPI
jgi:hypothetical protein